MTFLRGFSGNWNRPNKTNRFAGMVKITGNTFPVKDRLKELGCKYDGKNKSWYAPADKAEEAQQTVGRGDGPYEQWNEAADWVRRAEDDQPWGPGGF